MTYTEKRFEDYLETVCSEANPSVLDDDMPDFFDAWLGNQDVEDMIRHCNNFLATSITQAIAEDRERVRLEIEGYYIDVDAIFNAEKSGEWVLSIKHSDLLCILDTNKE